MMSSIPMVGMAPEPMAPPESSMGMMDLAWLEIAAFAPSVLSGIVILLGGWLAAVLVRGLVARVLGVTRIDDAVARTRLARILEAFDEGLLPSRAIAYLVYLAVLLLTVMAAADVLGLDAVEMAVGGALVYLPRLASALLVVAVGAYVAGVARRGVGAVLHEMRSPLASTLESVTELGLLGLTVLVAVDPLGLDISFVTSSLGLVLGIGLVTIALLFAWSMRGPAQEIVANYYLRRMVQLGDE
ncbi:MAG: hypothetical protein K0V04_29395, partial [Deltaproteobacteria bacterium]|nr:hypothetical protein [Deltaproteobacteria bacterium]